MPKRFRVACHLITWGEEPQENLEKVLWEVKNAGYDGVEGVSAATPQELVERATLAAGIGLRIVNIRGAASSLEDIRHNAVLGNAAVEVSPGPRSEFGGAEAAEADFERAARKLDEVVDYAVSLGLKPYHHAHVWTMIETKEDADLLLRHAPRLWLLLDTGHLLAAGSDPVEVVRAHGPRVAHVHLKDFYAEDPNWSHRQPDPWKNARFELLGKGNRGMDVPGVLHGLEQAGYEGWISVELDWHRLPAGECARLNRQYLASIGY